MNVKIAHIAAIFTVLALAGCANNGPYGGHSEKWYEKHTADMRAENKWCAGQSLDTQMHSKSCTQAERAASNIISQKEHQSYLNTIKSIDKGMAALPKEAQQGEAQMRAYNNCLENGGNFASCDKTGDKKSG
ncbi:hypothetical protein [Acidithiobacillus thiooxidans]|uniref:hypothetical protein n=1 Tax=Acidithiobacillus thiooxidans TaxID=930 RepID=UPI00129D8F4B|nr:hypothetical protein [Acidithiobacillus thiooxidans]